MERQASVHRSPRRRRCAGETAPGVSCLEPALEEDQLCARHFGEAAERQSAGLEAPPAAPTVIPVAVIEAVDVLLQERVRIADDWRELRAERERLKERQGAVYRSQLLGWACLLIGAALALLILHLVGPHYAALCGLPAGR